MRFPKYQWMQEEPINDGCGFCDVLYKTQNAEGVTGNSFQVILDTTEIADITFNTNPFDLITSDDLEFVFNGSFGVGQTTTLYSNGKVFIFKSAPSNGVVIIGNVYEISIKNTGFSSDRMGYLYDAFVAYVDPNCGTTTTYVAGTPSSYTVANIPTGSYINNSAGFLTSVTTVVSSGVYSYGFIYTDSNMCLIDYEPIFGDIAYTFAGIALTAGITYRAKIRYSSAYSDFYINLVVYDGTNTQTIPLTYLITTDGYIDIYFDAILTANTFISIVISGDTTNYDGFCIKGLNVSELIEVVSLDVEDCNGNITPFDYNYIYYTDIINDSVMLFDLADQYPEVFRFIITDSDDNTLTSRWYKVGDKDDCINGKLYSVKWTNTCNLGEIDYSGLPFTNELLLSGVLIKTQNDLLDSIENITASGKKISIYKNTQSVYEFRMNPYLSETFEDVLEGIFMHDTVTINGTKYNATDTVQTSELDLQVYTGRVDLYKDGTNLISKTCC